MSADPLDCYNADAVRDLRFQSILVPANIENYDVLREKACGWVALFDPMAAQPSAALRVGDPIGDPFSAVRVPVTKSA
jgi:hypothetical protein